jgi:hypothetical protein|tara:strand:+ start:4139 stop:4399 length:261 start_codon:yes stop_codon:yes gene_type:complete
MNKQFVWTYADERDYLKGIGSFMEDAEDLTVKRIRKMLRNASGRYRKGNFVSDLTDKNLISLKKLANSLLIKFNAMDGDFCPYEKK